MLVQLQHRARCIEDFPSLVLGCLNVGILMSVVMRQGARVAQHVLLIDQQHIELY